MSEKNSPSARKRLSRRRFAALTMLASAPSFLAGIDAASASPPAPTKVTPWKIDPKKIKQARQLIADLNTPGTPAYKLQKPIVDQFKATDVKWSEINSSDGPEVTVSFVSPNAGKAVMYVQTSPHEDAKKFRSLLDSMLPEHHDVGGIKCVP